MAALGALILAGGQNLRMGGDPKVLLTDGSGVRFLDSLCRALDSFPEKLLSTNTPALARGTDLVPVADQCPGQGPLGGLAAALAQCRSDGLVTVACDMPRFTPEAAAYLAGFSGRGWSAWAFRDRQGRLHPLCGVYMKSCLPAVQAALRAGERRAGALFRAVGGHGLPLEEAGLEEDVVCNVNTPLQLARLRQGRSPE